MRPTRAATLSGYNHHACNMGNITEVGTAYPGNLSTRPKDVTPVARVLRDNGYSTAQFDKCHETPVWEVSPSTTPLASRAPVKCTASSTIASTWPPPDTCKAQYFTISRNRGMYHDGWFAGSIYKAPWEATALQENPDDDVWELYNLEEDHLLRQRPAREVPGQGEGEGAAGYLNALPVDDRSVRLSTPKLVGRPTSFGDRKEVTLYENIVGFKENVFRNMKNISFTITAEVEVKPGQFTDGVVFCQGRRFGGYSLYVSGASCAYQVRRRPHRQGRRHDAVPNNEKVGEGRVDKTMRLIFSSDDTASVACRAVPRSLKNAPRRIPGTRATFSA